MRIRMTIIKRTLTRMIIKKNEDKDKNENKDEKENKDKDED